MTRHIIQVAVSDPPEGGRKTVVALCNDGTLWRLGPEGWTLMTPIPQPNPYGVEK